MKNERNRCQNCKFREDYGGGDSYCRKTGFGYRAEKYDCENFVDRENHVRESTEVTYQVNVPQNATNGDVLKKMFPTAKIVTQYDTFLGDTMIEVILDGGKYVELPLNWWNAPYKGVE